jgi:PAS domain S-box-containing protein
MTQEFKSASEVYPGFVKFLYQELGIICVYHTDGRCLYMAEEARTLWSTGDRAGFFDHFRSQVPERARSLWNSTLLNGSVEFTGSVDGEMIKFALLFYQAGRIVLLKLIEPIGFHDQSNLGEVEMETLSSSDAIAILNPQGKIVSVNASFIEIFSAQCNTLAGIAQRVHPDDCNAITAISRRSTQSLEVRIYCGSEATWFDLHIQPIDGHNGSRGYCSVLLRETEVPALRARIASLNRDFRFVGQHVALMQLDSTGAIIYVSPEFERLTGYFAPAFSSTKLQDWIHPDNQNALERALINWRNQSIRISMRFRLQASWIELSAVGRLWSDALDFLLIVQAVSNVDPKTMA